MAETKKSVDAVIIGYGWTGAILAKTLTDAGLSVLALERGPARDTSPDFEFPRIADELKYGVRGIFGNPWPTRLSRSVTAQTMSQPLIGNTVPLSSVMAWAAPAFTGTGNTGVHRPKT